MTEDRDPPETPGDDDEPRRRSRLEALLPEIVRRAIDKGASALGDEKARETFVADVVRRAIHVGNEVVDGTEEQVRKILSEVPVPKDVGDRVGHKLDELKAEAFRIIKTEVHEFLEKVDVQAEMQKLLTSLSFEIVTEVRFIPNEKGAGVKPDMKSNVRVKKSDEPSRSKRSRRAQREEPPGDES